MLESLPLAKPQKLNLKPFKSLKSIPLISGFLLVVVAKNPLKRIG
ncbi:hypothetical protein B1R32_11166 [Abditibacterium utsteinense]|uniref:Uncharacterized protein n=1 Tax=Abditibacterium utsteinense TaxID=1960156 RepID=A0A2S8SRU2_9BACT|nr:hypothetical protein B1R32_11166 [Abditibacterium utsteinense]